jgi:hypothetical protein
MARRHRGLSRAPQNPARLDHEFHPLPSNERGSRPIKNSCENVPREEIVIAQPQKYVLEQLNHTSGERRIPTRTKLDFVEFWIEVVVIHEQRVFVPIVGYFFIIRSGQQTSEKDVPSCSPVVSQCALNTRMPFG